MLHVVELLATRRGYEYDRLSAHRHTHTQHPYLQQAECVLRHRVRQIAWNALYSEEHRPFSATAHACYGLVCGVDVQSPGLQAHVTHAARIGARASSAREIGEAEIMKPRGQPALLGTAPGERIRRALVNDETEQTRRGVGHVIPGGTRLTRDD